MNRHGMTDTPEWRAWKNMRDRCVNPRDRNYANDGGRGIAVCDRWYDNFLAFYEDLGPRPSSDHSIDRVDNDGPYSPENCRWAIRIEQGRNRRTNRVLTFNGETLTVTEWAERLGVGRKTLYERLARGWSVDRVLTEAPIRGRPHRVRALAAT